MRITADLLVSALGARRDLAELYAPHLAAACQAYEINTTARVAHFLAQVGHESSALIHSREVWGPTPAQERYERNFSAPWPETPTESRRAEFAVNRLAYTLGNVQAGDGRKFLGRGALQTTGRTNYRALRDRLRAKGIDAPDFEAAPELLEQPRWAVLAACDYWDWRDINAMADRDDHEAVTRAVNGGTNGIEDRRRRLERVKAVLATLQTAAPAPPAPEPLQSSDPAQYSQEGGMPIPALVTALLPSVISAIPRLAQIFKPGSEVAERNVAAATAVMDIVTKATGTVNAQAAVEAIQKDPAQLAAATKAVEASWFELAPADGGGIEGARKASEAYALPEGPRFWWNPAFWITVAMLAMPYMMLVDVFFINPANYSGDLRTQIVTAVLLVISIVGGYWLGTSFSSARKTELGVGK